MSFYSANWRECWEARLAGVEIAFDRVVSLADAVMLARQLAEPGDVVLLSPGGTSFDAYSERFCPAWR